MEEKIRSVKNDIIQSVIDIHAEVSSCVDKNLHDKIFDASVKLKILDDSLNESLDYFSKHDVDFAYLTGVFNVSGIDGLQKEINRLKCIGKNPHDIINKYAI